MSRSFLRRKPLLSGILSRSLLLAALAAQGCGESDDPTSRGPGPDGDVNPTNSGSTLPPLEDPPDPVMLPPEGLECGELNPVPSEGRLLTRTQYNNTVRDLFSGRLSQDYATEFPAETQVQGFSTNAQFHRASPLLAERHMTVAERVSEDAAALLAELLPCSAEEAPGLDCAEAFIDDFGRRAFRRPMTEAERQLFVELYEKAQPRDGFDGAVQLLIQAFLQSPQFLYRFEFGGEQTTVGDSFELTGYELASRLSYFLWNSMPDEELFAAAEDGSLKTDEGLELQARRMLANTQTRDAVRDFYNQWLKLHRLPGVARDLDGVPTTFGTAWRDSLLYFVTHAFWEEGGDVNALMTSSSVFLNDQLAALYGVSVPEDVTPGQFFRVQMDPAERSGLLSQPGLMALYAHPEQSAPVQRGVLVLDSLLCQPPPPPPPEVNNVAPDPDPSLTTRERFLVHTQDSSCATCHQILDPLGLAFESYDQLGRYRSEENGMPVDSSGDVVGTREAAIRGPFDGAVELGQRLAESQQLRECMVTQWYRYGMGRVEQNEDWCSILDARAAFAEGESKMDELLLSIVLTDAFRYRGTTEVTP